jgi:hypothetical protein
MLPAARGARVAEPGAAEADGSGVGATRGGTVAGGAVGGAADGVAGGVTGVTGGGGVAIGLAARALDAGSEVAGCAGRAAQAKAVAATDIAAPRTNQKNSMT